MKLGLYVCDKTAIVQLKAGVCKGEIHWDKAVVRERHLSWIMKAFPDLMHKSFI